MRRQTARRIHEATNLSYWMENPEWFTGSPVADRALKAVRTLPFSIHDAQKRAFFHTDNLLVVSGESVVVANGFSVDKFMFRYPDKMNLAAFKNKVRGEVGTVAMCLADVAIPTTVAIKPASILRTRKPVPAVTQTQQRLELAVHKPLQMEAIEDEPPSGIVDRTARDLEVLVKGSDELITQYDYYPDIAPVSGNLRRSVLDGSVTLIDVMPVYANGSRLIGDRPPNFIPHLQESMETYKEFVGQYGA